jgi:hypothetical protein
MTAEQAIARSVSHNEIVTLGSASQPADNAAEVMADLFAECEDCADDDNRSVCAEYWGTTESGSEWRVHVWSR